MNVISGMNTGLGGGKTRFLVLVLNVTYLFKLLGISTLLLQDFNFLIFLNSVKLILSKHL